MMSFLDQAEVRSRTTTYRQIACLLAAQSIQQSRLSPNKEYRDDATTCTVVNPTTTETSITKTKTREWYLPAVEVTQSLLEKHPGYIAHSLIGQIQTPQDDSKQEELDTTKDRTSNTNNSNTDETYLPICQECGGGLQPGLGGTSLRIRPTTKLSRTQRRRASRRKATATKRERKSKAERNSGSASSKMQLSNLAKYIQDPQRNVFDCYKNYVVITCGYCGGRSNMAGIPNHRPQRKQVNGKQGFNRSVPKKKTKQETTLGNTGGDEIKTNDKEEEFLSLPTATASSTVSAPKQKRSPPTLARPKKKKKKSGGDLMSFLSSLND